MNTGWLCPRCDTANAPSAATCAACSPQSAPQLAPQVGLVAPQVADVVKVFSSKPSPKKPRYSYTNPLFIEFWNNYPLHREKDAANRAFAVAVAAGISPQLIIAAAAKYAAWCERTGVERSKIKYPSGWLNDGRWEDEYPELEVNKIKSFEELEAQKAARIAEEEAAIAEWGN